MLFRSGVEGVGVGAGVGLGVGVGVDVGAGVGASDESLPPVAMLTFLVVTMLMQS